MSWDRILQTLCVLDEAHEWTSLHSEVADSLRLVFSEPDDQGMREYQTNLENGEGFETLGGRGCAESLGHNPG